jgi:hypothetical protein
MGGKIEGRGEPGDVTYRSWVAPVSILIRNAGVLLVGLNMSHTPEFIQVSPANPNG